MFPRARTCAHTYARSRSRSHTRAHTCTRTNPYTYNKHKIENKSTTSLQKTVNVAILVLIYTTNDSAISHMLLFCYSVFLLLFFSVCVCVRACVRACACMCVRTRMCVSVPVCVRMSGVNQCTLCTGVRTCICAYVMYELCLGQHKKVKQNTSTQLLLV